MSARQPEMFDVPKRTRRHLAHVMDAGEPGCRFRCARCKWESEWLPVFYQDDGWERQADDITMTEAKRGIPCPKCNAPAEEE